MVPKAGYSTPMIHVMSIERSIPLYEHLGFKVIDTEGAPEIGWARLHCEGGAIMFLKAEEPFDTTHHDFLLYMYAPELPALRELLLANGHDVSEIRYPAYMPSGEVTVRDPDGYVILIAQWGDKEQKEWEVRLGKRANPA